MANSSHVRITKTDLGRKYTNVAWIPVQAEQHCQTEGPARVKTLLLSVSVAGVNVGGRGT